MIVGAGIGGLFAALSVAGSGRRVIILERDESDTPASAEHAFVTTRPGVPQTLQTHGFLARLRVLLRERFPDLLAEIESAGGGSMSLTSELGASEPGDDDLRVMVLRRSTFEWVLRKRVESIDTIELRTGAVVEGFVVDGTAAEGQPLVAGVRLADGTTIAADTVIVTTGTRGDVPAWLDDIGVACPEDEVPTGFVYLTRWYRTASSGVDIDPKLVGFLPFLRYLAVPGDGDTLSITLAVRADDAELRRLLSDPARFDRACHLLPGPDRFFGPAAPPLTPLGGVRPMAGLVNRLRRFTDEAGRPTVAGVHVIGDAHTTTNPLYGRGVTLAAVQAVLLGDAHAAHPDDPVSRSAAYEAACRREVEPWFDLAAEMDALESGQGDAPPSPAVQLLGALSMAPNDPCLGRALARLVNTLETPDQLLADPEVTDRLTALASDPDLVAPQQPLGPSRDELIRSVEVAAESGPGPWSERSVVVGDVELHVYEAGPVAGPLVVLVHGFPELAHSWRHQIGALADAGFRVIVPDQRGYGRSSCPSAVEAFDIHHLTADLIGLLDEAGHREAVFVGHDWGAMVVGTLALLHPERVLGVLTMSVPPLGRGPESILQRLERDVDGFFYMRYFQEVGPADDELNRSPAETITRMITGASLQDDPAEGNASSAAPVEPVGLIERLPRSTGLPTWLSRQDLDHYVAEFSRTGFTGAINWYRNLDRNWETTPQLEGAQLTVPSAHITGEHDPVNHLIPASMMEGHVTDHRFTVEVPGAGHWVQQEQPDVVNALLLRFLRSIETDDHGPREGEL